MAKLFKILYPILFISAVEVTLLAEESTDRGERVKDCTKIIQPNGNSTRGGEPLDSNIRKFWLDYESGENKSSLRNRAYEYLKEQNHLECLQQVSLLTLIVTITAELDLDFEDINALAGLSKPGSHLEGLCGLLNELQGDFSNPKESTRGLDESCPFPSWGNLPFNLKVEPSEDSKMVWPFSVWPKDSLHALQMSVARDLKRSGSKAHEEAFARGLRIRKYCNFNEFFDPIYYLDYVTEASVGWAESLFAQIQLQADEEGESFYGFRSSYLHQLLEYKLQAASKMSVQAIDVGRPLERAAEFHLNDAKKLVTVLLSKSTPLINPARGQAGDRRPLSDKIYQVWIGLYDIYQSEENTRQVTEATAWLVTELDRLYGEKVLERSHNTNEIISILSAIKEIDQNLDSYRKLERDDGTHRKADNSYEPETIVTGGIVEAGDVISSYSESWLLDISCKSRPSATGAALLLWGVYDAEFLDQCRVNLTTKGNRASIGGRGEFSVLGEECREGQERCRVIRFSSQGTIYSVAADSAGFDLKVFEGAVEIDPGPGEQKIVADQKDVWRHCCPR